jgi:hypothetical protein
MRPHADNAEAPVMNPNFSGRGRFRRRAVRLEARLLAEELARLTDEVHMLSWSFQSSTPISAKADYLRTLDAVQRAHSALAATQAETAPDFGPVRAAIADANGDLEATRARLAVQAGDDTRPYHPRD